jgi:hypothetical protein
MCGYEPPESTPENEGLEQHRALTLVQSEEQEASMEGTATLESPVRLDSLKDRFKQETLSDLIFEQFDVGIVKVTVSGQREYTLEEFGAIADGLEPGDKVAFACLGHVADVSSPYTLKDGHRGRLVLKCEVVRGIEVLKAADDGD